MEASYQYVDINNQLYSQSFALAAIKHLKISELDFKFFAIKGKQNFPALALGLRDAAGTGLFASEYLVMSKILALQI